MGTADGVCDYKGLSLATFNGCDCAGCPCEQTKEQHPGSHGGVGSTSTSATANTNTNTAADTRDENKQGLTGAGSTAATTGAAPERPNGYKGSSSSILPSNQQQQQAAAAPMSLGPGDGMTGQESSMMANNPVAQLFGESP
jgi:hypothetical protein